MDSVEELLEFAQHYRTIALSATTDLLLVANMHTLADEFEALAAYYIREQAAINDSNC